MVKKIGAIFLRSVLVLVLGVLVLGLVMNSQATAWKNEAQQRLALGSQLVETSRGVVEYAEKGSGPAILALHGTPGGYDGGGVDGPRFSALGYRYLTVSRPGYLRTPLSTGRTLKEQADAFAALLDALGIEKTAVIAGSGGGPVALQFAIRHPERCGGLVLVSAVTQQRPNPEGIARTVVDLETTDLGSWLLMKLITERPEWIFPAMDPVLQPTGDPRQFDPYIAVSMSILPMGLRLDGINNDFEQVSQMGVLPVEKITCPTLIIHGTDDTNVAVADAEFAAAAIPGAELVKVDQGTHMVILTHEDQLRPKIEQFLQNNAQK